MKAVEERSEQDPQIDATFEYCVIYVFGIDDKAHEGRLKVGETSIALDDAAARAIQPNDERLNVAAHKRIREYTRTADIEYDLLWTELGLGDEAGSGGSGGRRTVHDHDVHRVLKASGIERKSVTSDKKNGEWFVVDLNVAKNAIAAAKRGDEVLNGYEVNGEREPLKLRPEQREAVNMTKKHFKKKTGKSMLWDAKMRFGKTVSALTVAKEMGFKHTIIVTHRPVVEEGWYEDFNKIFYEKDSDWRFGGRGKYPLAHLQELEEKGECSHYIYFASLQDLRGSEAVGGGYDKDYDVFENRWDFVVIDEAHEGTQTKRAEDVMAFLTNEETRVLQLSGTPFNLYDEFDQAGSLFTWDYTAEQKAKADWEKTHIGEPNPYRGLPEMRIYTYELSDYFREQYDDIEDKAFNFREFFRVYELGDEIPTRYPDDSKVPHGDDERPTVGSFKHEEDVWAFLNLITRHDSNDSRHSSADPAADTCFPFATDELREFLRHTLWLVPGVKEARALSTLLKKHTVFRFYKIVNVAGEGDEPAGGYDALEKVKTAIGSHPFKTRTITLSCGKLTTGVTVPPWTGALVLSNTSSPATYLQAIFRVQSPADIDGRTKERCYAFDFAPDRTLKLVAEASRLRTKAGSIASGEQKDRTGEFLNFCPVIAVNGSKMEPYDVPAMMRHLKRAAAQAAVRNGFDDDSIYNDNLYTLTADDVEQFNGLNGIIGKTKEQEKAKDLVVNEQGFDEEKYESARKKDKKERTPEEQAAIDARNERNKQRRNAISILRGISIRIPMMIYGADVDVDKAITPDDLVDLVDDVSWAEFMPAGVTKEEFKKFTRFYDADVFIEAGYQIRRRALAADEELPEERVPVISNIFTGFRNPDKETVLTPWRVVNMQLGDTLGGYVFFDGEYDSSLSGFDEDGEPAMRLIDKGEVSRRTTLNPDTTYLEINSKSGLYPLLCAYDSYAAKVAEYKKTHEDVSPSVRRGYWNMALADNIYVVCKTPMAKTITERTLRGFTVQKVNCVCIQEPVQKIKAGSFESEVKGAFAKKTAGRRKNDMKFDVIVGNPPYQEAGGSGGTNDAPVYQRFVKAAEDLEPDYISMIIKSNWFSAGREKLLGDFRAHMLSNDSLRVLYDYPNSRDLFPNVEIKGGVCYFLIDSSYHGKCTSHLIENGNDLQTEHDLSLHDTYIRHPMAAQIADKIPSSEQSVDVLVSADTPFGIPTKPRTSKKLPFDVFEDSTTEHDVLLYYNTEDGKNVRTTGYIRANDIKKNVQDVDRPKAIFPEGAGSGNDPNVLGKPIIASKHSVCSQTYLYVAFDTNAEVENFIKYYKTRFVRFLVSIFKIDQHAPARVYHYVPVQDFTNNSDIDWTRSAEEIDDQLFDKYKLSEEERDFIKQRINPMS